MRCTQGSAKQATAGTEIKARVLDVNPVDGIVDLSLAARFLSEKACAVPGSLKVRTSPLLRRHDDIYIVDLLRDWAFGDWCALDAVSFQGMR